MSVTPGVKPYVARQATWVEEARAFVRRFFRNRSSILGAVVIAVIVACAVFANQVSPYSPVRQDYHDALMGPSIEHLLGTDSLGRDVLSRIIFGARISLVIGLSTMSIASVVGVPLGLMAGFQRGVLDSVIMRAMDGIMAFPSLILAIFLVTFLGPSTLNAMIAVAIGFIPAFARITRANVLSLREKDFVLAARIVGGSDLRLMFRHILPNCLSPIIVQFALGIGWAILIEASLSFLGLGAQPPTPSWGSMVAFGRQFIGQAPWMITFPGLAMFVTVLSFNFLGDGLREALDPGLRWLD